MARTSKKNIKKRNEAVEYESPLNLLPYDIWVKIATKVASNLIQELFQMQATCKVFLDATRFDAVYKQTTMWYLTRVGFSYFLDQHATKFIERFLEARNPKALFRDGLMEYFWIGQPDLVMEWLTKAAMEGHVETSYGYAMLLLCHNEDKEHRRRGVEFFQVIRASGAVERCRWVFRDMFQQWWVEERSSDLGQLVNCRSTRCPTGGVMGVVKDVSSVLCLIYLANYEVRVFLEMFT